MNTMYAAVARRVAGDRHAARAGLLAGQHSAQLLPRIGAALGAGRRARLPAGAAAERHHDGHRKFATFAETAFDFHVTPEIMLIGHRVRRRAWARSADCSRRAMAAQKRNPDRPAGNLTARLRLDRYGRGTQESANRPHASGARRSPRSGRRAGSSPASCCSCLLGAWRFAVGEAERGAGGGGAARASRISAGSAPQGVVLNATGYIVAAHKIEVAAKVIGKVEWIGVDKGDRVKRGPGAGAPGRRRVPGAA